MFQDRQAIPIEEEFMAEFMLRFLFTKLTSCQLAASFCDQKLIPSTTF